MGAMAGLAAVVLAAAGGGGWFMMSGDGGSSAPPLPSTGAPSSFSSASSPPSAPEPSALSKVGSFFKAEPKPLAAAVPQPAAREISTEGLAARKISTDRLAVSDGAGVAPIVTTTTKSRGVTEVDKPEVKWDGNLRLIMEEEPIPSQGDLRLEVKCVKWDNRAKKDVERVDAPNNREVQFHIYPWRWNLYNDDPIPLVSEREGPKSFRLKFPNLASGWYRMIAVISDDEGRLAAPGKALRDSTFKSFFTQKIVPVYHPAETQVLRLHTERSRCVYSLGEKVRFYVSGRGAEGVDVEVSVSLVPLYEGGRPREVASGPLKTKAGESGTLAFEFSPASTEIVAPGRYALELKSEGQVRDIYPISFMAPERPSGGARWAHTMQYGYDGGVTGSPVTPWTLKTRQKRFERVEKRIHHANFWNNFFSNSLPVRQAMPELPSAQDPRLPPLESQYRPSLTHAFYQMLMDQGMAFGITLGWGEDYRAETYMPLPTIIEEWMDTIARKYLNGSQAMSQYPNFVSVYTDFYGHMDYTGGGEIAGAQSRRLKEALWKAAIKAAGIEGAERPYRYDFNRDLTKMPENLRSPHGSDKAKRSAWSNFWKVEEAQNSGDKKWKDKLPEKEKMALWKRAWASMGVDAPEPNRYYPFPELDKANQEKYGKQANYDYASFVLSGIERVYGRLTEWVEDEVPAVFSVHNRWGMNHSGVSHAWSGFRTPNIDPAYLQKGASAISVSEWNLDSVPKPYLLPTFYNRPLVDTGHPVYRCALWKQMGMPSRFMRDAVMWGGRQIHVYFDQTKNMTWSHKGSDQTSYASNERLSSVTEFLSVYTDLFNQLEPVREVGFYIPPMGSAWGTGITRGHYIATLTALMADHQVHYLSHGDIDKGGLEKYSIVYAPGIHCPSPESIEDGSYDVFYPFEKEAFKKYVNAGGHVVGAPPPNYYHDKSLWEGTGIRIEEIPDVDHNGNVRKNRDGSTRMKKIWHESFETWAEIDRKAIWGWLDKNIEVAPIDIHTQYTHLDENGRPAKHRGSHWTGHHKWAGYRGPSLAQYRKLSAVFEKSVEPKVVKDQPEVFTNICKPKNGGEGYFLFASNWTLPDQPELHTVRVPQGFFNSGVKPVVCTLAVKNDGDIGAVYDIIRGEKVDSAQSDGRVVFRADLDSVEGRVFALYPREVKGAVLKVPQLAEAGQLIHGQFELQDEGGKALAVMGSVSLRLKDGKGRLLSELHRAVGSNGRLPPIRVPAGVAGPLSLEVLDRVTGFQAEASIEVQGDLPRAVVADAITVHRGQKIHDWLKDLKAPVTVVVDSGRLKWSKKSYPDPAVKGKVDAAKKAFEEAEKKKEAAAKAKKKKYKKRKFTTKTKIPTITEENLEVTQANPMLARQKERAQRLVTALKAMGIDAKVLESSQAVKGKLRAHPWTGKMSGYRQGNTVPGLAIPGPVVLMGSVRSNSLIKEIESATVSPRSLGLDNTSGARGVLAWMPRCFSLEDDSIILAAEHEEGFQAAMERLKKIHGSRPAEDEHYLARERARFLWAPGEVRSFKASRDLKPHAGPALEVLNNGQEVAAVNVGNPMKTTLGTAIFSLHASEGGVAIGTKSWARPLGLVSPDGEVKGFFGGAAEVTPRDVAVSSDGESVAAGFSLFGRTTAYRQGEPLFQHKSGVVYKADNAYTWDTFKDSDRHLAVDPSARVFLASAGAKGLVAYEANTGKELWRIPNAAVPDRPLGQAQPEMAFSPDGSRLLVAPLKKEPAITVTFPVKKYEWDDKRNNFNKRKTYDEEVSVKVVPYRSQLMLVDASNGRPVWTHTTGYTLYEAETGYKVWSIGAEPVFKEHTRGKNMTWKGAKGTPPKGANPGEPLDLSMWHLYSAVGPKGKWTITGTREAKFALLDDQGRVLRIFEAKHLPPELSAGHMIPPTYLACSDEERILSFAPENGSFFRFKIHVGSSTDLATARKLQQDAVDVMRKIKAAVNDRKNYNKGAFGGSKGWVEKFLVGLPGVPADLKSELGAQMNKIPGELRARRKRDSRFFEKVVAKIQRHFDRSLEGTLDRAVGMNIDRRVDTESRISDARTNGDLSKVYAGFWDQSVRAFDMNTGEELWAAPVVGGCQIATVLGDDGEVSALYAGGSRGDLYRIDPENGKVLWRINITDASNNLN